MNNKQDQLQPLMAEQEGMQNLEELQLETITGGTFDPILVQDVSKEEILKWLNSGSKPAVINIHK